MLLRFQLVTHNQYFTISQFLLLQSITLDDFSKDLLDEAASRTNVVDNNVTYFVETLCYHLFKDNIPGTSKRKFDKLFKLANLLLCIIHSKAEEPVLSIIRRNLTL